MGKKELVKLFYDNKAIVGGHYEIIPGRHSNKYLDAAYLLCNVDVFDEIALGLKELIDGWKNINGIACPYPSVVGHILAKQCNDEAADPNLFVKRVGYSDKLKICSMTDDSELQGKNVVLASEVILKGRFLTDMFYFIKGNNAEVVDACTIVDLNNDQTELPVDPEYHEKRVKVKSLLTRADFVDFQLWVSTKCPLCEQGEELRDGEEVLRNIRR